MNCLILKWAVNEARTRDPQLGKLVLYQLSYYRIFTVFPDLKALWNGDAKVNIIFISQIKSQKF